MENKATGANRPAVQPFALTSASKSASQSTSQSASNSAFTTATSVTTSGPARPLAMPPVPTARAHLQKAGAGGVSQGEAGAALSTRQASTMLDPALAKLKALARELEGVRPEAIPARSVGQASRLLQAPMSLASWDRIDRLVTAWIREVVRCEPGPGATGPEQVVLPPAMVEAFFELLACMDDERRDGILACGFQALRDVRAAEGAELQLSHDTEVALVDGLLASCLRHAQDACAASRRDPPGLRDMDVRTGDSRAVRHLARVIRESSDPAAHLARAAGRIARVDPPLHPVVLQRLVAAVAAGVFAASHEDRPAPQALAAFIAPLLARDDRLPLAALVHAGLGLAGETVHSPWWASGIAPDGKSAQWVLQDSTRVFMQSLLAHARDVAPARLGAMVMAMVHAQNLGPLPSKGGLGEAAVTACVEAIVRADPPVTPAQRTAMVAAIGRELVPQGRQASNFAALDGLLAKTCSAARARLDGQQKAAVDDIERGWQLALDPASVLRLEGWDERARFELLELLLVVRGRIEDPQAALESIGALKLDASREWMRAELALRLASGTSLHLAPSGWHVLHQALLARLNGKDAMTGSADGVVIETKAGPVAGPAKTEEPVVPRAVAHWGLEEMAAYCAAFESAHGLPGPRTGSEASDFARRLARAEGLLASMDASS